MPSSIESKVPLMEKITAESLAELVLFLGRPRTLVIPVEDWDKALRMVSLQGRGLEPRGPYFWILGTRVFPATGYTSTQIIRYRLSEDECES